DMDYTLARYHREHLERLAQRHTIEKLVKRGYPDEIIKLVYDPRFVIRGLTVDKQLGNILKIDRHSHVGRVYHGRRALTKDERRALYRTERMAFRPPRFALVDTLFSLPETCLYADLVDFFAARSEPSTVDTWKIFDDVRESIDEAHRDGTLKSVVKADLATYVEKDPLLARTMHKLRSSGKKLFVITNSAFDYTDHLMRFLLDGELPEYAHWTSYFEWIVVGARKPGFFMGNEPFIALENGRPTGKTVATLERGKIYEAGNLKDFERMSGIAGEQVLYVGDHIYGDILRSKKSSLWRTALVVEELEDEIRYSIEHAEELARLADLELERRNLDELTSLQRQHLAAIERKVGADAARASLEFEALRRRRDQAKRQLKSVINMIETLETRVDVTFNSTWGFVFKESGENSRFAEQVKDHACIYTSRVSNFLHYSTHQYFRAPRDLLPHERDVLSAEDV
ncbi:MAG: HAD-IG family 5'-nucleotidase, partial [Clostridia bacterium]|nr:HAD-IG family 5'-nucleotidase [Deltaproteobacteria bacterium]